MHHIEAGRPLGDPPDWAVLERSLLDLLSESIDAVLDAYVEADGSMAWPADGGGLDDAYESFFSWPLLYALGGDERVLDASIERWEAITEQFASDGPDADLAHPPTVEEFPASRDWMHQGEGKQFFYYLCLAAPDHERFRDRAARFADLYLPEGPGNYDPEHRIVTAPHTGSAGPRDPGGSPFEYAPWKDQYHLPFTDVEGVDVAADLKDPDNAAAMGDVAGERWGGDTACNLAVTSLMTNAYLMTGEETYREWVEEYVDAWRERTAENGGIIPDNVGPSGEVGELLDGKWYGNYYGWTWPHGWSPLGDALVSAGQNATLLSRGETDRLDFVRSTIDALIDAGIERDGTLYVPFKHGEDGHFDYRPLRGNHVLYDEEGHVLWRPAEPREVGLGGRAERGSRRDGWFEFQPMKASYPAHLWLASMAEEDDRRLRTLRDDARGAWEHIGGGGKDAGGNEGAWSAYLRGEFPDYPERILRHGHEEAADRLAAIRADDDDFVPDDDAYLQRRNPVDIEGLVHCTMGGPLALYNAGLLRTSVRHFDPERSRPGLPPDVAALVSDVEAESTTLDLVNLGGTKRRVTVQAGTYGEHDFGEVSYESTGRGETQTRTTTVEDSAVAVSLPGGTRTRLQFETERYANDPSYEAPWQRE